jgi:hypothetical protein
MIGELAGRRLIPSGPASGDRVRMELAWFSAPQPGSGEKSENIT